MEWKEQLRALEKSKDWDFAIAFMEDVIKHNSNDMKEQPKALADHLFLVNTRRYDCICFATCVASLSSRVAFCIAASVFCSANR